MRSLPAALVLLLVTIAQPARGHDLVGVWELSRLDNVPPADTPPYGAYNVLVAFGRDGSLRLMTSLEDEPAAGKYELSGDAFKGWLGLTNDRAGRARFAWATSDRFELTYPDELMASFRRVSTEPTLPRAPEFRCVPVTIRGANYDASHVALAKRLLDQAATADRPKQLFGAWMATRAEGSSRFSVRLVLGTDGILKMCAVDASAPADQPGRFAKAPYSVREGHIVSHVLACGDPVLYSIKDDELVVGQSDPTRFQRERDAGRALAGCKE
jgi:hypothetical protein